MDEWFTLVRRVMEREARLSEAQNSQPLAERAPLETNVLDLERAYRPQGRWILGAEALVA